ATGDPDLLSEVHSPDGTFLQFSYNAAGQRTRSVDQAGFAIDYTYDAVGRLTELSGDSGNRIVHYTYDDAGRLVRKDQGNGTGATFAYDADGNVTRIVHFVPDGSVNSFDQYTYDAEGNVLTDSSQDGQWTNAYDADGQLVRAVFVSSNLQVLPNQDLQYAYDAMGNRLSQTIN